MNLAERQKIAEELFNESLKIFMDKGIDYSGDTDSLANFKINAERAGITKYQVWQIYFNKHVDAINNAIKNNPKNPQVASEPLRGRINDIINYAALLASLLKEDEGTITKE
jgi:hypothetical protein